MTGGLATGYVTVTASAQGVGQAITQQFQQAQGQAASAGQSIGQKFSAGFGKIAALAGAAGFGAILKGAADAQQATSKLQAQLGLTADETKRFASDASSLFANNFAGSIDEANDAIKSVVLNIGGMRTASDKDLQSITGQVTSLAQTFDQDLGGVTKAVGQQIKTGLAKNAQEALDNIAVGFQKGVDKSGDFLDTLNEYGVQFQKLGIDGKTATGLLSQGLQAGARDADLVADAFKEFSIRAIDGSSTTVDAYKKLGLNAKETGEAVASGGATATAATQRVLDGLRGIEDPAKRAAIATELFGTQSEDLGKALFSLDLKTAASGLGDVAGAAQKVTNQVGGGANASINSFVQSLQATALTIGGAVLPVIEPLLKLLGPIATGFGDAVTAVSGLPGPVKIAAAAMGALVVFRGPLRLVFNEIRNLGTGAGAAAGGFAKLGKLLAGGALFAGVLFITDSISKSLAGVKAVTDDLATSEKQLSDVLVEQGGKWNDVSKAALDASVTGSDQFQSLLKAGVSYGDAIELVRGNASKLDGVLRTVGTNSNLSLDEKNELSRYAIGLGSVEEKAKAAAGQILAKNAADKAAAASISAVTAGQNAQTKALTDQAKAQYEASTAADRAQDRSVAGRQAAAASIAAQAQAAVDQKSALAGLGQEQDRYVEGLIAVSKTADYTSTSVGNVALSLYKAGKAGDLTAAQKTVDDFGAAAQSASTKTDAFAIAVDKLSGRNVSLQDAQKQLNDQVRALSATFGDATETAKVHADTLITANGAINTSTEAGSKLYDSVEAYSGAYNTSVTAAAAAAGVNATVAQRVDAARIAADKARGAFITQAESMGISEANANKLADQMGILEGKKLTPKELQLSAQDLATAQIAKVNAEDLKNKSFQITATIANNAESIASTILGTVQSFFNNNPVVVRSTIAATPHADGGRAGYANGGISGKVLSGTGPRADDVPVLVSKGEWIINAKASAKHNNLLASINSGRYASGGIAGFATGGVTASQIAGTADPQLTDRLGRVVTALSGLADEVMKAHDTAAGDRKTANDNKAIYQAALADQTKAAKEQKDANAELSKATKEQKASAQSRVNQANAEKKAADAQVAASRKVFNDSNVIAAASQHNAKASAAAQRSLQGSYRYLQGLASRYDALTAAGTKLADQRASAESALASTKSSRASDIASGANSIAGFDGGLTGHSDTRTTSGAVVNGLKYDLAQITSFKNDIAKLSKLGLSASAINDLTSKFGSGGEITARALAAGPASDVKAVNAFQDQIQKVATQAATYGPTAEYAKQIADQTKTVNSLVQQQKVNLAAQQATDKALKALGSDVRTGITKGLREADIPGAIGNEISKFHLQIDGQGLLRLVRAAEKATARRG